MPDIKEIEAVIFAAIDELNASHPPDKHLEKSLDTVLFGKEFTGDSLDLLSLIVFVEEAIAERFGVAVALANEDAFARESNPFKTVGAMAEYAKELLDAAGE